MPKVSDFMTIALCLLAGCNDAQLGPQYRGEPLLKIQGTVTRADDSSLRGSLVPVIAWWLPRPVGTPPGVFPDPSLDPSRWVLHDVGVQGEFPAEFTLSVYEPPPRGSRRSLVHRPGGSFSVGYIVAVRTDHPRETPGNVRDPAELEIPIAEGVGNARVRQLR